MIPASAAMRPEAASANTLIAFVRTPTARTALSLDPGALIQAPRGVKETMTCALTTTARLTMIRTGTPPIVPAIAEKPNGRDGLTASGLM